MALLVHKYGGTSVGSIERINAVADRIIQTVQQGHQLVVVVSAMSGETNRLINLATQLDNRPSSRELDVLMTTGEQVTASLLSMALVSRGYSAISLIADQVGIKTSSHFGKARIQSVNSDILKEHIEHGRIVIAAGFQGRDEENNITTLGRGGTDTSAVAIAAAIGAEECLIFTDVEGVYTTDPRIEPKAKKLDSISFEEMIEFASLGAKVLQKRSVELAGKYQVKLRVLSSFLPLNADLLEQGTLITYEGRKLEDFVISGISVSKDEAMISFYDVSVNNFNRAEILTELSEQNIEIDIVSQSAVNAARGSVMDFTFTLGQSDYVPALVILRQYIERNKNISIESMQGDESVAKISLVGIGMKSHAGVVSKVFTVLAAEHIPVLLVSTSEIKISVLIDQRYTELSVRALHNAFELHM
ncbi:aspartate kinase [Psychrosphaera haliotis]|uniref:aspartate kinase n=1 Tax=Psychrosphaera haliotis TaxID=555083 RepID=UPI0031D031CC